MRPVTNSVRTLALAATLAAAFLVAPRADAQISTGSEVSPRVTAPADAPVPPLVIPAPPGATVMVEMDVQDADLLGVYKSFLRGIGQGGNLIPSILPPTATPREQALNAQLRALFSNYDLADIFKDTTHVHMIVFQTSGGGPMGMMSGDIDSDAPAAKPGKAAKPKAVAPPPPAETPDQTAYYETAFAGEGGHRIIFVNVPPAHVLMTSFGHLGGYALMVQGPGVVAVLRANGYPDLSKLSALATQIGALAAEAAIPYVSHLPMPSTHLVPAAHK